MTKYLSFFPLLLLGALLTFNASAFVPPSGMSGLYPPSVQGSTVTYGAATATAQNSASSTFGMGSNGKPEVSSTQAANVGGGKSIPVTVKASPSAKNIAKAVAGFAARLAAPLVIGNALWTLCNDLGFQCSSTPEAPNTVTVNRIQSGNCYVANATGLPCRPTAEEAAREACTYFGFTGGVVVDEWFGRAVRCDNGYLRGLDQATQAPSTVKSSLQELEDAIAAKSGFPQSSTIPLVLEQAVKAGVPLPLEKPHSVTGPSTVVDAPSVTEWPDGSKTSEQTTKAVQYGPDSATVTTTTTRTTTDPQGNVQPVSTTTTSQPLPQEQEKPKDPCGLPDTPACVVDGSNVPTAEELPDDQAKKTLNPVQEFLNNPFSLVPALPTINWAFALPTACGNIPTPAFAPYLTGVDVCQFQPMFHELMTMVWMLGGLFGAISLFMRSSLAD